MGKLLGNKKRGLAFVVSAPAGTGKTTLVKRLVNEFPDVLASVSCTTRGPRLGEIPDKDYYFITAAEFDKRVQTGDFLEHVDLYGTKYGTSKELVERLQSLGKHVVLVIDTQGAMQLKDRFPCVLIFIRPPSVEDLKKRLMNRATETQEEMDLRLVWAKNELDKARHYDYQIVNDNLEDAYQVLRSIIIAESHKTAEL